MNTKAKSNSVITHSHEGMGVIRFTVLGVGDIYFDTHKAHLENRAKAEIHGWIQRTSDAAAIPRDLETGESATAQDKFDAMQRLVAHYESGTSEWSRRPQPGEGKSGGLLFKALCAMSPSKAPEEIRAWMGTKTKAQLSKLRIQERVAAMIAQIRPVDKSVDADSLLEEFVGE